MDADLHAIATAGQWSAVRVSLHGIATRGQWTPGAAVDPLSVLVGVRAELMAVGLNNGPVIAELAAAQVITDVPGAVVQAIVHPEVVETHVRAVLVTAHADLELVRVELAAGVVVTLDLQTIIVEVDDMSLISSVNQWPVKVGETRYMQATIKTKAVGADDADATALDLTGATSLAFRHEKTDGTDEQVETVTAVDAASGQVRVEWDSGTFAAAESRRGQFEITLASGEVVKAPTDGAIRIRVAANYGPANLDTNCFD